MKTRILIIAFIFCFKANSIFAQAAIGGYNMVIPDTVYASQPDSFFVEIKNTGSVFINGLVSLKIKVNANPVITIDSVPMLLPVNAIGIFGQENFSYDSLGFLGPAYNIVVVWPVGTGMVTSDSVTKTFFFVDDTGISRKQKGEQFAFGLYPNPAKDKLNLKISDNKIHIEGVRIYDFFGREVIQQKNSFYTIDISGLTKGMYYLEIICADNKRSFRKFVVSGD